MNVKNVKVDTRVSIFKLFLVVITLVIPFITSVNWYKNEISRGGNFMNTGDWLINYSDGFIRRGLTGQIFISLTEPEASSLWWLFLFQCFLYFFILLFFLVYMWRERFSWQSILFACSPAAIPFIGYDTGGFGRKEGLGIIALILVYLSTTRKGKFQIALLIFSILVFFLSILSWEVNFVFLPGFVFILYKRLKVDELARVANVLFVSIVSILLLLSSLKFSGRSDSSSKICSSLRNHGLSGETLCEGSIKVIGVTANETHGWVIQNFPNYLGYLPFLFLALLPILSSKWSKQNKSIIISTLIVISPIFFVAVDYGRWIFIVVMQLTICFIATSNSEDASSNLWSPLSILLFISLWGMPHSDVPISWWRGAIPFNMNLLIDFLKH